MRGRLWWQTACLVLEGLMVLVFAHCNSLAASIIVLVIFSTFVQVSEGSTFGIVPYIDSAATGSISGIVGAGGNVGAVCFGLAFRYQLNYYHDFMIMGGIIIASGVLSLFICIKGHAGLISGQDSEEAIRAWKKLGVDTPTTTLQVPVPDEDAAADIEEDA
jgi:NNP family nitrate/nitrite transporter-like MFS transporter